MKLEKNFMKVPNEFFEAIAQSRAFSEKTRILAVIIRKTWGWNKDKDWISNSQFAEFTGMKEPNVCRALKKLKRDKIIIQVDKNYFINETINEWSDYVRIIKPDKKYYRPR